MESAINPKVWRVLFHSTVGTLVVSTLFSLYHERYDYLNSMRPSFNKLRAAEKVEDKVKVLGEIISRLQSDAVLRKSGSRLSALKNGGILIASAKLEKDGSNAAEVSSALKAILRVFGADAKSRKEFYRKNGLTVLLATLSEAHRQGNRSLMEETAQAMKTLTRVAVQEVVLETDVPEGSEGAYSLAHTPATVRMLRILDPQSPVLFLSALTGVFENICALHDGAIAVGKGIDGRSGISYFTPLLAHGNTAITENCTQTIYYLARAGVGHDELATEETLSALGQNLSLNGATTTANAIALTILAMAGSSKRDEFLTTLMEKTHILETFFDIWVSGSSDTLRERSEVLVTLLSKIPVCQAFMANLFEKYKRKIAERRALDEQAQRRRMQQMQENQMRLRMMQEQMGMGGEGMESLMAMMGMGQ